MNYLFFDIECANCDDGNGKICSFGYVLTDGSFNVKEYTDLLIDPQARFKLRGYGKKSYIQLAYPEEAFYNSPPFEHYYERIKSLLTMEDTLIFGYAPDNDASFLRSEFERFRLDEIDFVFYDVQHLFKSVVKTDDPNMCSLSRACEMLMIDTAFITHKSCDDAYATMLVLKALCAASGKSADMLVSENPRVRGHLKNGEIFCGYFKPKPVLQPGEENMIKGINKDNFRYLLRRVAQTKKKKKQSVAFSWVYENRHYREMVALVALLARSGYKYTSKLSEADIFVKKPIYVRGLCRREKDIYEARSSSFEINKSNIKRKLKVLRFIDLLELLAINEDDLNKLADGADAYIEGLKNGKSID